VSEPEQIMHEIARQIEKQAENLRTHHSNLMAQAESGRIEGEIGAERQELDRDDRPDSALPGETDAVPFEAEPDGAWNFGQPDAADPAGASALDTDLADW
jgi:hypothetical protein